MLRCECVFIVHVNLMSSSKKRNTSSLGCRACCMVNFQTDTVLLVSSLWGFHRKNIKNSTVEVYKSGVHLMLVYQKNPMGNTNMQENIPMTRFIGTWQDVFSRAWDRFSFSVSKHRISLYLTRSFTKSSCGGHGTGIHPAIMPCLTSDKVSAKHACRTLARCLPMHTFHGPL